MVPAVQLCRRLFFAAVVALAWPLASVCSAQAPRLTTLRFDIVGLELKLDPAELTVPKNIPTQINTLLDLPDGAGPEAQLARRTLEASAFVEAELRGPGVAPTQIVVRPGQPIPLPPFALPGDYFLEDVRLVKDGQTVLSGTPDRVAIHVINEILVTSVTSRPMSLQELQAKGVVIDDKNFQVLNFELALNFGTSPVKIQLPVAVPSAEGLRSKTPTQIQLDLAAANARLSQLVQLPPELERPGINFSIAALPFYPVREEDEEEKPFAAPITGLVLIPGNVAYLNQFFSVLAMVTNVAPDGTPLILRDVTASITLPAGLDRAPGTYDAPGDDPLRLGRIEGVGIQPTVNVLQPGPDGKADTGDESPLIMAQETGQGEFIVEGLREGIHSVDIAIDAVLDGLPSGPVRLRGQAGGVVMVRNPKFALALSHPRTVRTGETYELFATVTNTSETLANLVSVRLDPRAITGAQLTSSPSQTAETLGPGDSFTARFELIAQRTGDVDFSYFDVAPGLSGRFELRTGIGERGIPLSGATIVLPRTVGALPASLVAAAQRVLGQSFSIATTPPGGLPSTVLALSSRTVQTRGIELAEAGQRVQFGEPLARAVRDLLFDWFGARTQDPGFDQLLRTTRAGAAFLAEVVAILGPEAQTAGWLDFQQRAAETLVSRSSVILAATGLGQGTAPVTMTLSDASGRRIEQTSDGLQGTLPYGYTIGLLQNASGRADAAALTVVDSTTYVVEVRGTSAGHFDLGVVLPPGASGLTQLRFTGVPIQAGGVARLIIDLLNGTGGLSLDETGDGIFERIVAPSMAAIVDAPPSVVAAKQVAELTTGHADDPAVHGLVIGVLFSEPVQTPSAEDEANYAVDNNEVRAARLQPSGRLVYLLLQKGIGHYIPRTITIGGIADLANQQMASDTQTIVTVLDQGGQLLGQVRTADGLPVANALVTLKVPFEAYWISAEQLRTRDDGTYDIDFVGLGPLLVEAFDEPTNEVASRTASLRSAGDRLLLNLVFIGKGTVRGRVLAADGVTVVPRAAVFLQPAPSFRVSDSQAELKAVTANELGAFVFTGVPVGNFVLRAYDNEGNFTGTSAGVVQTAAGEAVVDVVLTVPRSSLGAVNGRVFRSDGINPLYGAVVYVGGRTPTGTGFVALASATADAAGSFSFPDLPVSEQDVVAVDPATGQTGSARVEIFPGHISSVAIVMAAMGAVEGVVRNAQGQVVAGAVVAGGLTLGTTDANGFFRIEGVPAGQQTIEAGDPTTKRRGSAAVTVLPGQTVSVAIVLEARATIVGRVLDANGQPVPGATVRLPRDGGFYFVFANNSGFYRLPDLTLGEYLIEAPGPDKGALIEFMKSRNIDPRRAFTAGDIPPELQDPHPPQTEEEILQAYSDALRTFIGLNDPILNGPPPVPGGGFGWTKVKLLQDSATAVSDIRYLAQGSVGGVTLSAQGIPMGALVRVLSLKVDDRGFPRFAELARRNSDPQTGAFRFDNIPRFDLTTFQVAGVRAGDFTVEAVSPFSPAKAVYTGQLNTVTLNDLDIQLRFPALQDTNGTVSGRVVLPDGVTPAGENVEVVVSFGDLTLRTDPQGRFASTFPIPGNRGYTLTATDPVTHLKGQAVALVPAGGNVDVVIRLVGLGSVVVNARRADGTPIVGSSIQLTASGFPPTSLQAPTDADGRTRFTNVPEGAAAVLLQETGTTLVGRANVTVVRDAEVDVTVMLAPSGTVRGIFVQVDGRTPVPNAQIELVQGSLQVPSSTDASGRFEVAAVPVGQFTVTAFDPINGRSGRANGEVPAEGFVAAVTIVEAPRGVVEGTVFQATGSTRVPGATVSLGVAGIEIAASTRLDGSFSFDGVPSGDFSLSASDPATGFSGTAHGRLATEGETVRQDIYIAPFGTVRVTVLGADGAPAGNARVVLAAGSSSREGVVDEHGVATFDLVPLGKYALGAASLAAGRQFDTGKGAVELTEPDQTAEATVRLGGVGDVFVAVHDTNDIPVGSGARVTVSWVGGTLIGFTDVSSVARISGVPVGSFFVTAEMALVAGLSTGEVAVPEGQTNITVQLSPSASIRGRVLLPGGTIPAAQAFVTLNFAPRNSLQSGVLQVTTGLDGRFAFDAIPLGPFTISILEPVSRGVRTRRGVLSASGEVLDVGDLVLDNEAPRVASVTPDSGATGVSRNAPIVVQFTEPMDRSTFSAVQNANVTLRQGQSVVPVSLAFSDDNQTMTVTPGTPFGSALLYALTIKGVPEGPKDTEGLQPVEPFVTSFLAEDYIPPAVVAASPADGGVGVLPEAPVRITFSESIGPAFVLTLTDSQGHTVGGQVSLTLGNTVIGFVPNVFLAPNERYTVAVTGVQDLAGNALAPAIFTATFATIDTQAPTLTALEISGNPSRIGGTAVQVVPRIEGDDVERVEYIVGQTPRVSGQAPFGVSVDLPISAAAIDVVGVAVDRSGNRSSAATLTIPIVLNQPPTAILTAVGVVTAVSPGTTLQLHLEAADDLALSRVVFTVTGAVSVTRTFDVAAGQGTFSTDTTVDVPAGASGLLTLQAAAIDSVGRSSVPSVLQLQVREATPPTVTISSPSDGATVTSGQPIDVEVAASDDVGVVAIGLSCVPQLAGCAERTITSQVSATEHFVVQIPVGFQGDLRLDASARDGDGAAGTARVTVHVVTPAVPAKVTEITPQDQSVGVPLNSAVVVRFAEPVDPASVAADSVRMTSEGVPIAGTLALSADRLSVTFRPASPLAASTAQAVEVNSIRTARGGVMAGAFVSSFTTGTNGDATAPQVVRVSPGANAVAVPVGAPVVLEFSERVDPATVTEDTFQVATSGIPVTGSLYVNAEGRGVSFVPELPLVADTPYTVSIGQEIADLAGNSLPQGVTFTFRTTAEGDVVAPQLSSASPAPGAADVPTNARVVLQFSEPLAEVGTLVDRIALQNAGTPVAGAVSVSDGGRRAAFQPAALLEPGAAYAMTITGIRDLTGNSAPDVELSFTSGNDQDLVAPTVLAVSPADGTGGVSLLPAVQVTFSERVSAPSVSSLTLRLLNEAGAPVKGSATVAPDGLSATVSPDVPLAPGRHYVVEVLDVTDYTGRYVATARSTFTTAGTRDTAAPTVVQVTPPANATDVPSNAQVAVRFSEPILAQSISTDAMVIRVESARVPGSLTLDDDGITLRFHPTGGLPSNMVVALDVAGVTDESGNVVVPFSISFQTGAGGADINAPSVVTVAPADGATGVSAATPITLTFDEAVNPLTVTTQTMPVTVNGAGPVAGTYVVAGAVVTFTPTAPWPTAADVRIVVTGVRDLAGNIAAGFSSTFRIKSIGPLTLSLGPSSFLPFGAPVPLTVTLPDPAPSAGVDVGVSSDDPAVASVAAPGTVHVPAGARSAQVTLTTAAQPGPTVSTTVRASAPGYDPGQLQVGVTSNSLSAPATSVALVGDPIAIPITISPIPTTNGLEITVGTSDPTLMNVVTPTVAVSSGTGSVSATVRMLGLGTADVVLTAPGFPAAITHISSHATLDIVETQIAFTTAFPAPITIRLRGSSGSVATPVAVPATLSSTSPDCASVPAGATIAGGTSSVVVNVTYGSASLPCSTTITAAAALFGSDSVPVTAYPGEGTSSVVASTSFYNPAPVPPVGGTLFAGTASVSFYNPAPVPPVGGTLFSGMASLSFYNPAPVPSPDALLWAGATSVSFYNPAPVIPAGGQGPVPIRSLSFANGPVITGIAPARISRSTGLPVTLTITGANLTGATTVAFDDVIAGVLFGAPTVSDDGRTLTVVVSLTGSTPIGFTRVVVSGIGWTSSSTPGTLIEIAP